MLCSDIKRFLDQNPNEIITIFYEDYTEVRGVLRGNCRTSETPRGQCRRSLRTRWDVPGAAEASLERIPSRDKRAR